MAGACRPPSSPASVTVVDFIKEFARAETRPPDGYSVVERVAGGIALPAILGPAPGRLTWVLPLPRGGTFRVRVSAGTAAVRVRIGVSDERIYEQLAELAVAPDAGWSALTADLSAYAGRKFSLFYRPERRQWRLNLSADALGGLPGTIAWGSPEIVAATENALEYSRRRARLTRSGAP